MVAIWSWSLIESQYMENTLKLGFLRESQTVKLCTTHTHPPNIYPNT